MAERRSTRSPQVRRSARSTRGRTTTRIGARTPGRPTRHRGERASRAGRARRVRYRPAPHARSAQAHARARLKRFRVGSALVVGLTALLLLLFPEAGVGQDSAAPAAPSEEPVPAGLEVPEDPTAAVGEATGTLGALLEGAYALLPKLVIAVACLLVAWLLGRLLRFTLHRLLGDWKRADAVTAVGQVVIWLVAFGTAMSVVAGDARALLGSVGLTGLALSWALQAPIESFTGWLLNSFRGYYRLGDRIAVGEVFGDVYRIDLLTTTVWEAGGPDKAVQGAQPTGALVTFPNSELLRANITNFTRDFPFVWDEVSFGVANESDLSYVVRLTREVAERIVGDAMAEPAATYGALLEASRLSWDVATEPQVYLSGADFWTNVTVRYLAPARARRVWASRLHEALTTELGRPDHADHVLPPYVLEHVFQVDGATAGGPGDGGTDRPNRPANDEVDPQP